MYKNSRSLLPPLIVEIIKKAYDDQSTCSQLAELIRQDSDLNKVVVRAANNSTYRSSIRISDTEKAVWLLGKSETCGVTIVSTIHSLFSKLKCDEVVKNELLNHIVLQGLFVRRLCDVCDVDLPKNLSVAGWLMDVGRVALACCYEKEYKDCLTNRERSSLEQAELKKFEASQSEVGSIILKTLTLPNSLTDIIAAHHSAHERHSNENCPHFDNGAAILCIASHLAEYFSGCHQGESLMNAQYLMESLGCDTRQLQWVLETGRLDLIDKSAAFGLQFGEIHSGGRLLGRATKQLPAHNFDVDSPTDCHSIQRIPPLNVEVVIRKMKNHILETSDSESFDIEYFKGQLDVCVSDSFLSKQPIGLLIVELIGLDNCERDHGVNHRKRLFYQIGRSLKDLVPNDVAFNKLDEKSFVLLLEDVGTAENKKLMKDLMELNQTGLCRSTDVDSSILLKVGGVYGSINILHDRTCEQFFKAAISAHRGATGWKRDELFVRRFSEFPEGSRPITEITESIADQLYAT